MYRESDIKKLEKEIYELEMSLLRKDIREYAEKVEKILCKDFMEHCSSGAVYHYARGDSYIDRVELEYEESDFKVKILDLNSVLAIYNLKRKFVKSGEVVKSRRSSIWKKEDGTWKMFFHQGTNYVD